MALELWETLKEAIPVYTGLSPATFFTVIALFFAVYYVISGLFGSSDHHQSSREYEQPSQPPPPPVQLGEISEDDLKQYDGSDPEKPLLMAIKGQIYDVSQSRSFMDQVDLMHCLLERMLAELLQKCLLKKDLTGDITGLGPFELEALQDWEFKFMSKYVKVGTVKSVPVTDGAPTGEHAESTDSDVAKPAEDGPSESAAVITEETPAAEADAAKE